EPGDGQRAVADGHHLVVLARQRRGERVPHHLLVVHDQYPGHGCSVESGISRESSVVSSQKSVIGRHMVTSKRAPPEGRLEARIVPSWASTMRWTIARPRPVPVSLVVKNG